MFPLINRPALTELGRSGIRKRRVSPLAGVVVLRARRLRRNLRPAGRIPDGSARPPSRADVEHSDLRVFGVRRRLHDESDLAAGACDARRSSVSASSSWRRRRGSPNSSTTPKQRESVLGWTQAFGSIGGLLVTGVYSLIVSHVELAAGDPRRARAMALHADVRRHPRDSADYRSAVPAGISDVAREEGGRHAEASEPRRSLRAAVPAHDDRDDDHVCVQLRRGVRRDPADAAADRARAVRTCARCRPPRGSRRVARGAVVSGNGRACRAASCSRFSPFASSAAARCLRVFQVPGLFIRAARLPCRAARTARVGEMGNLRRGCLHRCAVQFLGQLHAEGLSRPICAARARASRRMSAAA